MSKSGLPAIARNLRQSSRVGKVYTERIAYTDHLVRVQVEVSHVHSIGHDVRAEIPG